ncbi:NAD(P)-binding protein [Aspergillus ellipticus CBS 707.79]|uniref:NAD(P)-binding protein n=1 Tax=Aspergillus ellipticus CBS 707.79 TaxID=1448320 RepID=A0A319EW10_9EURO|nr:NAD(P)-binding protein [Aspergillus ellipticus CBS 707.79]
MTESVPSPTESLFKVDGLVAVITGGGSGLGLMMTRALIHSGASKIYILGRRLPPLQAAATQLGPRVIPIQCDVTSPTSLQSAAQTIASETGYINLLICNSGISGPQVAPVTPSTGLDDWVAANLGHPYNDYVNTLSTNTAAVWYTTMHFLGLLDSGNKRGNLQQSAQVIVVGSIAAFNKLAPGGWAYGQSKAAVVHAVKQLGSVLPNWGIRANCIAPGLFPSEMTAPTLLNPDLLGGSADTLPKEMVPLERPGNEDDMMGTVLYLASRAGGYTNGAVIVVDGGRLGRFPSTF